MEWGGEWSQRPQQWGWTCELGRARELPGSLEREEGQSTSVNKLGLLWEGESLGWEWWLGVGNHDACHT